jgi:hypothetical protein
MRTIVAIACLLLIVASGPLFCRAGSTDAASVPYVSTTFPPSGLLLSAAKIISPVAVDRVGGKFQDPVKKGLYHVYLYLGATEYGTSVFEMLILKTDANFWFYGTPCCDEGFCVQGVLLMSYPAAVGAPGRTADE